MDAFRGATGPDKPPFIVTVDPPCSRFILTTITSATYRGFPASITFTPCALPARRIVCRAGKEREDIPAEIEILYSPGGRRSIVSRVESRRRSRRSRVPTRRTLRLRFESFRGERRRIDKSRINALEHCCRLIRRRQSTVFCFSSIYVIRVHIVGFQTDTSVFIS